MRERGLKYLLAYSLGRLLAVAPGEGAWIEISMPNNPPRAEWSPLVRGEWIEMPWSIPS